MDGRSRACAKCCRHRCSGELPVTLRFANGALLPLLLTWGFLDYACMNVHACILFAEVGMSTAHPTTYPAGRLKYAPPYGWWMG